LAVGGWPVVDGADGVQQVSGAAVYGFAGQDGAGDLVGLAATRKHRQVARDRRELATGDEPSAAGRRRRRYAAIGRVLLRRDDHGVPDTLPAAIVVAVEAEAASSSVVPQGQAEVHGRVLGTRLHLEHDVVAAGSL